MSATAAMVARSTCFHHPQREAAAKCVSCGRSFCRECITPIERRMYCAGCYRETVGAKVEKKRDWFVLSITLQLVFGLLGLWFTAYFLGRSLLEITPSFHDGTVWERIIDH